MTWLVKLELSLECDSLVRLVSILRSKIWVGLLQLKIVWFKFILFLTLTFGWKNEKQPSGPIELDLEAGNLVLVCFLQKSSYLNKKPSPTASLKKHNDYDKN